ncbi:MAG TPA: glycosyltransferase [Saprospiraceae bacterium]|nr:glycosyltransferase [Saprospiraceae bacterium]
MPGKPEVVHFQRKNRVGGNFSLEFIFEDVRKRLADRINFRVVYANRYSNGIYNRIRNTLDACREQGEINHVTGDIHYVNLFFDKRKTILTILDCGFMKDRGVLRKYLLKLFWLKIPEKKSTCITAISNATKDDIVRYTGCDPAKVFVIPVAVSELFQPIPKEFNSHCPVLLQLGTASNKNLDRLIRAIENINCKLVIIGRLSENQIALLNENRIEYSNFVFITPEEVYSHYINCDIVTLVSTYEGFGMPIIEANCVERVVVTGNNTSMPEVGGDAACYVDAFSEQDIRKGILSIIENKEYRDNLIEKGKQNKLRFSGESIAAMYENLYNRIYLESKNEQV